MNKRAIPYKGEWLFPGSDAHFLYNAGELAKLDKHLKEVNQRYKELHYEQAKTNTKVNNLKLLGGGE